VFALLGPLAIWFGLGKLTDWPSWSFQRTAVLMIKVNIGLGVLGIVSFFTFSKPT
jgi:hypothetical protein